MLPKPTAEPAAAKINPILDENSPRALIRHLFLLFLVVLNKVKKGYWK